MFGQRLDDYNDGKIVPLYQFDGANYQGEFAVPACTVRHVEGVGAVSEWAYCTDRMKDPCVFSHPDGRLGASDGTPIDGFDPLASNSRLNPDQEKLIAYLVQHPIVLPTGTQEIGSITYASPASDDADDNRLARQLLVWCISDPFTSGDFKDFCDANMGPDRQAEILAMIPLSPEVELSFNPGGATVEAGDTVEVGMSTNIYGTPITLTATGGIVTVCPSSTTAAVLTGNDLIVNGTDPTVTTQIALCATSDTPATVTVNAAATPPSVEHISWNQSPGTATIDCQVFATFETTQQIKVTDGTSVTFVLPNVTPTPTATPGPSTPVSQTPSTVTTVTSVSDDLPDTGGPNIWWWIAGIGAITLGTGTLALGRRRN